MTPVAGNVRLLLDVLREPAPREIRWPSNPEWDWRDFTTLCDRHAVSSFVYCRLRNLNAPSGLLHQLRLRFYEISGRNYHLTKKLIELTSLLERERIPVLAYKGPAVAMMAYGDLVSREHQDIDVMVREEDLIESVALMKRLGFEHQPFWAGRPYLTPCFCRPENPRHIARAEEIPFHSPDRNYFVDLHWNLGPGWRTLFPDIRKVWDRVQKIDLLQAQVSTFCREDLFLILCSHGTKHRWSSLKWLVDIARLLHGCDSWDWSRVEEMVALRPKAGMCASLGLLLAQELLALTIPQEAARVLPVTKPVGEMASGIRDQIMREGQSSGHYFRTVLELEERPLARMKYRASIAIRYPAGLFSEVVVQVCEKDRALIFLPKRLNFLYYLIRPARLMGKHLFVKPWLRIVRRKSQAAGAHVADLS